MLVSQRFYSARTVPHFLRRCNSTLQHAQAPPNVDGVPPPPPPPPANNIPVSATEKSVPPHLDSPDASTSRTTADVDPKNDGTATILSPTSKGRVFKTRRPHISLARPREWNRPIAPGVLPAYDEALKLIKADSEALEREAAQLEEQIKTADARSAEKMMEKLNILQVQSKINLPDVRWKFANGMADMSKPVYRHLAEQRWREDGALDLLMERIHQMKVVPDLLPAVHPSFDLRVTFPEPPPRSIYLRTRVKRKHQQIEPGVFLLPEQTRKPPNLYASVFHTDTRLYTLLMLDPDVPDPANQSYQTYLHWMQPNIPLSCMTTSILLPPTHTRYIPPHPQRGTPYHRYVVILLPQPSPATQVTIPVPSDDARSGFNVRAFAEEYGFDASKGGGVHMWREVWDAEVSKIYQDVLKVEEPRFGIPRKPDPYAEVKSVPRYV